MTIIFQTRDDEVIPILTPEHDFSVFFLNVVFINKINNKGWKIALL